MTQAPFLSSLRLKLRTAAVLSPGQLIKRLRKKLGAADSFAKIKRKLGLYTVYGVEKSFGSDKAHQLYWRMWPSARGWLNTENRLTLLTQENPQAIDRFVALALEHNTDPTVLIGLARSPLSAAILTQKLRAEPLNEGSRLTQRVKSSQQYAATLIGVGGLLFPPNEARAFAGRVMALQRQLRKSFFQIIDSLGCRPALPPSELYLRGLLDSGFRQPTAHRLVITEDFRDARAVAQLFPGARKVTLIALNDAFGRTDVSEFIGKFGVEEIVVEHIRTRVARFSQAYVRNHDASRAGAAVIARAVQSYDGLMPPEQQPFLEVALADFLHFQCLKVAALEALCADPGFDHIVIASGNQREDAEFFRLMSGVEGLAADPRVEMVSVARAMAPRAPYYACVAAVQTRPDPVKTSQTWANSMPLVLFDLDNRAARLASHLPKPAAQGSSSGPKVVFFSNNNTAYNASTARYAAALAQAGSVDIVHAGLNADALQAELSGLGTQAAAIKITPLPSQFPDSAEATQQWLTAVIFIAQAQMPTSTASLVLRITAARIAREVIEPQLLLMRALDIWLAKLAQTAALPDLVVLAPYRLPIMAAVAAVARRHGVASLTLESHGLNANYSRYLKVTSDFYGVVSEYFRQQAATGFGMPLDRVAVIGTPRLIAPQDHDPLRARAAARALLAQDQGLSFATPGRRGTISFFCQPSAWDHVALVWRSILLAAQALDLNVLLKPHPEETPTRIAAYRALAQDLGMTDAVHLVTGPATPVIEASDVVLTAYSAAALDAAVLQVPVICVTEGDVAYPVDQHVMVGAALVHSSAELQAHLAAILADPAGAQTKAADFLRREPQFVEGPDSRLQQFVADILALPPEQRLRAADTLGPSVFLDGPHPVFPV